ncbi:MAG: ATP-binding cassette domain-containing protein [Planctomycetes bacterium]|nr:ATP-binding cassette domain-containing protein [Planctomycetota bacterium]
MSRLFRETTPLLEIEEAVVVRGLVKRYGELVAVAGIDFAVARGELFGLLGPNGAGKTSTMRMLYGGSSPTEGRLEVLGLDVASHRREVKMRLGVVPQETNLDQDLLVRQNLLVHGRFYGLARQEREDRADELLDFFQLRDKANAPVETISGGMKRRLLIARALMSRPEVLVIDEPTTGLDPQARHLLWGRLRELRDRGVTMILSTHYMDEAERLCDRLVILDRGKILAEGTPRELIEMEIGRQVLEIELAGPEREGAAALARDAGAGVERSDRGLLCYARDAEALLHHLRTRGVAPLQAHLRMATLEDVFLRLTGRSLVEG